jgi:methyl-accepting chemotaxis protein
VLGLAAATQTLHISKEVTELYGRLQQGLLELKDKNSNSRQILDLLQSISRETHLLSLNASIEAAGAGQFGERFGVIAQEVKNLAERSNRSSAEVALQLKEAELSVNEAVEAVQSGFKKTLEMKEVAEQTGSVITRLQEIAGQAQEQAVEINNSLQEMREKSEVIRITTHQQRTSSEQVMESLHGLVAVAQQNSEGSQEVSHTAGELENVSRKLREVF